MIYVLGKKQIDAARCAESFVKALAADSSRSDPKTVVLKYDVAYAHLVGMLLEQGGFHCLSD